MFYRSKLLGTNNIHAAQNAGRTAPMMAKGRNYTKVLDLFEDYADKMQMKHTKVKMGGQDLPVVGIDRDSPEDEVAPGA